MHAVYVVMIVQLCVCLCVLRSHYDASDTKRKSHNYFLNILRQNFQGVCPVYVAELKCTLSYVGNDIQFIILFLYCAI